MRAPRRRFCGLARGLGRWHRCGTLAGSRAQFFQAPREMGVDYVEQHRRTHRNKPIQNPRVIGKKAGVWPGWRSSWLWRTAIRCGLVNKLPELGETFTELY